MHASSFKKAELFVRHYAAGGATSRQGEGKAGAIRVLEVGSKSYHAHDTFKSLFPAPAYAYTGLDVEAGPNVDVVPADGYIWSELADNSFDVCISGQTFEHNPFFWVTFSEMARVVRPGGHVFVVAPGGGAVHRYPYDCWRFYPDSWLALCHLTGMTLLETYFEPDSMAVEVQGGKWRDSAVIASKPVLDAAAQEAMQLRLAALVAPFKSLPFDLGPPVAGIGPCFSAYEAEMGGANGGAVKKLSRRLKLARSTPIFER